MKKTSIRRRRALSIRTRVLTLALVPSLVFLIAGAFGAGYLIFDAARTKNYFQLASSAQDEALPLIVSLQEERRLTLRTLASLGTRESDLRKSRTTTDALAGRATNALEELSSDAPDSVNRTIRSYSTFRLGCVTPVVPTRKRRICSTSFFLAAPNSRPVSCSSRSCTTRRTKRNERFPSSAV